MPLVQTERIDPVAIRDNLHHILQAGARLYMHFARETLAAFGEEGGATIRLHLREYGAWRGDEMREAHNALGRPINMETLNRCWDSASVFVIQDDIVTKGHYSATDVIYDVHYCPASEAWKAEDFHRWGHVYCDEFHQACASTYHPDGNVVIPINMMKGDDHCHFRWVMPGSAEDVAPWPPTDLGRKLARHYQAETPERAAYDALVRTSRLIGGRYWTMVQALRARHPSERAERVVRSFVRAWAAQRGELLRERHIAAGTPLTPANLVGDMDCSPSIVWEMEERTDSALPYAIAVSWTPMDDAWGDLDASHAARMFWEESIPAMAESYRAGLRATISSLVWRGDPTTVVEFDPLPAAAS